jgi:thiamine-phosphate pyrophosphorylase
MNSLTEFRRSLKATLVGLSDPRAGDPLAFPAHLPARSWLILRHYDHPDRASLAKSLKSLCRARRIDLLIGDDFDLAVTLRVGLHLREKTARAAPTRLRLWQKKTGRRLSVAAHGANALRVGWKIGADAALLSPLFATNSHPNIKPMGLLTFRRLCGKSPLPIIALGGITARSVRALNLRKLKGIAAIDGWRLSSHRDQDIK